MSILHKDFVKITAESIGMSGIKDDVASQLIQDVEYRLREVLQEAKKFMRHSRRTILLPEDVNSALSVKNVEPLYGYMSPEPAKFKRAAQDLFYLEDEELDFEKVLSTPLPKLPMEISFTGHWLAIEGVQPAIPQNPPPQVKADAADSTKSTLVKDVLSKELQIYYEKISGALVGEDQRLRQVALDSLSKDPGLQSLLPYFLQFVHDNVTKNMRNLPLLAIMVDVIEKILDNVNFFIEPYLHQLVPTLLTTIVAKKLSQSPKDPHWALRTHAARILARIATVYSKAYSSLLPRITKTLLLAFCDKDKPFSTHYGAVTALGMLGEQTIRLCLFPNLKQYGELVSAARASQDTSEEGQLRKEDCERVVKAIVDAVVLVLKRTGQSDSGAKDNGDTAAMVEDMSEQELSERFGPVFAPELARALL
ncbi:histone H4-like TAF Taf6, SAGA complex subunit [Sorochytrium milnesiophthora]